MKNLTLKSGEIAGEFGLGDEPSTRDLEEQAAATDRAVHRRVLFETRGAAASEAQERLNEADSRLQEATDNRTLAYNNYATAYARWQGSFEEGENCVTI